jgi:hypothetical protein
MSLSCSPLRKAAVTLCATAAALSAAAPAHALEPFRLASDQLTYPGSTRVVDDWKFVGRGSASAVQIAPRWVMTCDHSSIKDNAVFRNGWGEATVLRQFRPSTNYADADGPIDLTLHLLDRPISAPRYPKLLSHPTEWNLSRDLPGAWLGVGFGGAPAGDVPTYGWVDGFGNGLPRADHQDMFDQPVGAGGDSGGGVFYFASPAAEGVLGATLCLPNSPLPGLQTPFAGYDPRGANIKSFLDQTFAANPSVAPAQWTSLAAIAPAGPRPSAPTGVKRSGIGATSAKIVWTHPVTSPVARTGYTVFRNGAPLVSVGPAATSATITGLTRSTAHTIWVAATSTRGMSYPSPTNADLTWFRTGLLW